MINQPLNHQRYGQIYVHLAFFSSLEMKEDYESQGHFMVVGQDDEQKNRPTIENLSWIFFQSNVIVHVAHAVL